MSWQLVVTLYSLICGAVFGALYDVVRITRIFARVSSYAHSSDKLYEKKLPLIGNSERSARKSRRIFDWFFIFAGDIIFFAVCALIFAVFAYHFNSGHVRWYMYAGIIVGFSAYYLTLGRLVMLFSEYIVFAVTTALRYVVYFILLPLRFALSCILRLYRFVVRAAVLPIINAVRRRYLVRKTERIKRELVKLLRLEM